MATGNKPEGKRLSVLVWNMDFSQNMPREDIVVGRNAVMEALRAGRPADSLLIARGERSGSVGRIMALCREAGIAVKEVSPQKLDHLGGEGNHQGVALITAAHAYASVQDMLTAAKERQEAPFLIVCDEIEDPHNLGAIIRTAEAAGVHGVIIPKRRSAGLTGAVAKAASGALEYIPVARVANLVYTLQELKKQGFWIYGADMGGSLWNQTNYAGPVALVIGSEGRGLGRLVRETCDGIVALPMRGRITSLNASVAAGIIMYEIARQRDAENPNRTME